MIVERHYDDETLIGLLASSRESVPDPHLAACVNCADALSSYRTIADVLGAQAVWDLRELRLEARPETVDLLRQASVTKIAEEENATFLVAELLSLPRASWVAVSSADGRMHTVGVVDRLVEVSETLLAATPPDGVETARAAVEIAGLIATDQYHADTVLKARASALMQYAYTLFYTGDFKNSLAAVARGEEILAGCAVADYELARLGIVRTLIHSSLGDYAAAHKAARASAATFRQYGDNKRLASALTSEAYALIGQGRYDEALPLLLDVEGSYRDEIDLYARSIVLSSIAACEWQAGQIASALQSYQVAAAICDEIGEKGESARIRLNVAVMLMEQGNHRDAEVRLVSVREEFQRLGMQHMATCAGLEVAEIYLLQGKYAEVEKLCREALQEAALSGLGELAPKVQTALTYLRESAVQRRATPEEVRHVKEYIGRLPAEPKLIFAPPPLPPG